MRRRSTGASVQSPQLVGAFSSACTISSSPRSSAAANGPGMIPAPIIMPMSMSLIAATPSSTRRHASTSDLSWKRSTTVSRTCSVSAAVLIETLSGLLAEVAGFNQLLHRRVDVEALAVAVDHVLRDVQRGVEARHVGQEERAHRERLRLLDLLVDLLRALARLLLRAPDLGGARHQDAVDDEARDLAAAHGRLADCLGEVGRGLESVLRRSLAFDHFDQAHHRRGPEEVEADDLVGAQRRVAHLRDRQPRRVGREDRVAGCRGIEVAEDLLLDVHPLRDGLDHEVDVAQLVVGGRSGDPPEDLADLLVGLVLGDLLLLDLRSGLDLRDLFGLREALVDELLVDVLEDDWDARRADDLGDFSAHRPSTDDGGFGYEHGGEATTPPRPPPLSRSGAKCVPEPSPALSG